MASETDPKEIQVKSCDFNESAKTLQDLFDMIYLVTTPAVDPSICKIISNRIKMKETSLVNVVEELGPRLTSTHVQERSKAVEILAHVFTHLPSDFLNESELSFIVDFLCDRCKDQHMVMPKIIMCTLPIVKCKQLPSGAGAKLLENLFREANVQSHIHKIRNIFFKTLQVLLGTRLEELQNHCPDFIMNFLQSMDGEKDPRNLLLLFRIIPRVISNFKLEPFLEDFFEILSSYFPIDFNPSVSIPGEEDITRKDLANSLHICLSQTNEFAEFLVPLVLEKLESSSLDAKLDSLELLEMCCERSYLAQDVEPYLGQIWHIMRREVFMGGGGDEVEGKCLLFLKAAFKMISKDETILNTCLTMIYTECKHHLSEPELRLIMPTCKILQCIAESGFVACTSVVQNMFPVLYSQICLKAARGEKKRLLDIWVKLVVTCQQYKDDQINFKSVEKWDEARALFFTLLTNEDWEMVTLVLKLFSGILATDSGFSAEHRNLLQEHMIGLIGNCSAMPQETRSAIISLCCTLCHLHGPEFAEITVPQLLSTLSHSSRSSLKMSPSNVDAFPDPLCNLKCADVVSCDARNFSVKVLGESCHRHVSSFSKVVPFLLREIEENISSSHCLLCLRDVIQRCCEHTDNANNMTALIIELSVRERLLRVAVDICRNLREEGKINSLREACIIIRCIMRHTPQKEQEKTVDFFWNDRIMGQADIERELLNIPGLLVESMFGTLRLTTPLKLKKELAMHILTRVLSSEPDPPKSFTLRDDEELHILPHIRLLSSLINKVEDEELQDFLNEVETIFDNSFGLNDNRMEFDGESGPCGADPEGNECTNLNWEMGLKNKMDAFIWIVKSLAMRGVQNLEMWVDKILKLLHSERCGGLVVKSFHYLLSDDPFTLNPESFCRFKFLYKQRLFLMLVDKLVSGYRTRQQHPIQFNFIRALSSQLTHVPSEVLFMKIDSVLPLLVASLKCNTSTQVLLSSLNSLIEMMDSPETKSKMTEFCHDLIPQLTRLSQYKESMDVRITSLKCLRKIAHAPSHVVMPLKDSVVDSLLESLDDHKRLVRKEAAITRNVWLLIGAPGGI